MAATCLAPLILSPATSVWFLSLHPKHPPPSIFLFFLNVIVKCSSEMTLNVYINRGNTLGYILLTHAVVWSVHRLFVEFHFT